MFGPAIANDFVWLRKHGLIATDFDSLMGHWASAGANYYATARMHWAPTATSASQVLEQWSGAFNGAQAEMNAYLPPARILCSKSFYT